MGYDGSLKFDTKVDESGFNQGTKKLGTIAKSGLSVLASAVAGVTAAMGAGVAAGVKYNASIEQYQTSFEVMTGSAEKAVEVIDRLKKVGAETPFELNNLADTTQLLMNYGFTADDAMDKMMMLGDISQGSAEKMQRIATAYGQMSSAGKVSLEDIKQMIEAGFNPLQEISQTTGESMSSLYKRISDGKISVDEITASMQRATSEGGKYFQSMEKQSQTINGLISTLKDNAQQLLGEVVQPITESFRTELLPAAIEAVEGLSAAFAENGTDGLIEAGSQILANLVTGIAENAPVVIDTAVNIINSFITSLGENIPQILEAGLSIARSLIEGVLQIGETLYSVGGELLSTLISGISERLPELVPQALAMVASLADGIISHIPMIFDAGISLLGGLVQGIINSLPTLIAEGPRIINDFANAIYSGLGTLITTGLDMIVSLVQGLWDNKDLLLENAGEIFMAFLNIFSLSNMVSLGKNLLSSLQKGIKSFLPNIKSAGKEVLTNLVNGIKALANDPVSVMLNISRSIRSAITSFSWSSIGSNIISGIASGLKRGVGTIISAAKSAAASALTAAKKALGIKSPSRRFRDEVGKMMAVGMGEGFEKNVPVDEMQDTIDTSVKKMQKASYSVTSKTPATTSSVVAREVFASAKNPTTDEETTREIVIHTHVELDGEKVGDGITRYVDRNMADNEELKERGC